VINLKIVMFFILIYFSIFYFFGIQILPDHEFYYQIAQGLIGAISGAIAGLAVIFLKKIYRFLSW